MPLNYTIGKTAIEVVSSGPGISYILAPILVY